MGGTLLWVRFAPTGRRRVGGSLEAMPWREQRNSEMAQLLPRCSLFKSTRETCPLSEEVSVNEPAPMCMVLRGMPSLSLVLATVRVPSDVRRANPGLSAIVRPQAGSLVVDRSVIRRLRLDYLLLM